MTHFDSVTIHIIKDNESQPSVKGIIAVEI